MASEITNYQCPACTAPLRFDGESGKLTCDFCGSTYEVSEIEKLYAEKDKAAADASEQAEKKAEQTAADLETAGWEVDENLRAYQCPTCGAVNKGKFCPECGAKKPAGVPQYRCDKCGWEPPKGTKPPKFCPECGDPFDDGDIV